MKLKVLVVGQTPPPHHGQAIVTQRLLEAGYGDIALEHVRLAFSGRMGQVSRFSMGKLWHLLGSIGRIAYGRWRSGAAVLYYMPAGPRRLPMYRDLALLICTRWLFRATVFHFHAAGLSELYPRLDPLSRGLFRLAYGRPEVAIELDANNPPDGRMVGARVRRIVPNGVPDDYARLRHLRAHTPGCFNVLYVGALCHSKGVMDLLEAFGLLAGRYAQLHLTLVGEFQGAGFEEEARRFIARRGLGERVTLTGLLTGDAKWVQFLKADAFCFPTFYENESFGMVTIEAMQFELPVVATRWRANASLVEEGHSGLLVEARNPAALAEKLEVLVRDPSLGRRMGRRGRELYEQRYTLVHFRAAMGEALRLAGAGEGEGAGRYSEAGCGS